MVYIYIYYIKTLFAENWNCALSCLVNFLRMARASIHSPNIVFILYIYMRLRPPLATNSKRNILCKSGMARELQIEKKSGKKNLGSVCG